MDGVGMERKCAFNLYSLFYLVLHIEKKSYEMHSQHRPRSTCKFMQFV